MRSGTLTFTPCLLEMGLPPILKGMDTLDTLATNEEKLRFLLDLMRQSIEQSAAPNFKQFWKARERCVPLFKEGIHPAVRSLLWQQLCDLSKEARMLSDLHSEKAAFAGEQIGLAIDAIETEIERVDERVKQEPPLTIGTPSRFLEGRVSGLDLLQRKLVLYTRWTTQIGALRKDLIALDIRMREKNALFKRLASLSDMAFPKRRELLEEMSNKFVGMVDHFKGAYFSDEEPTAPFFVIKEEIKALQAFAKTLTLSAKAFKVSREVLSESWDLIRNLEKTKKTQAREKEAQDKEFAEGLIAEIKAGDVTLSDQEKKLKESGIGKREYARVLAHIGEIKEAANAAAKLAREEQVAKSRKLASALEGKVSALISEGQTLNGDELAKKREAIAKEAAETELNKQDREGVEAHIGRIADLIVDAEENAFLKTPDDHPEVASRLALVLDKKGRRRQQVKETLEELRKEAGGSSHDFEVALKIDAKIQEERDRLEALDQAIKSIHQRLKGLKDSAK